MEFEGFDWDEGNREKCKGHGLMLEEIEQVFAGPILVLPDRENSRNEKRFRAIGSVTSGRRVFVVFTFRGRSIRPISARYMHDREVKSYEEVYPDLGDG